MGQKIIKLWGIIPLAMILLIGVCPGDPTILAGDRRCDSAAQPNGSASPLLITPNMSEGLVDDIPIYKGLIGPDNIFYGLKKTFEDLDELFTFNASDKLKKQIAHAEQRIAETRTELRRNNTDAANRALDGYLEKTEAISARVSGLTWNETGLLSSAGDMILSQRDVLHELLDSHPENMRIRKAYTNSQELYERFMEKIGHMAREKVKFEEEKKKIEARIFGNVSQVEVSIGFMINNSKNTTISKEILRRVMLSRDEISYLLEIKEGEGGETFQESMGEDFSLGINITVVKVYSNFSLNTTSRDEIIEGIYQRLSESPYPIVPSSTPSMTDWLEQETGMK